MNKSELVCKVFDRIILACLIFIVFFTIIQLLASGISIESLVILFISLVAAITQSRVIFLEDFSDN